MDVIVTIPMKPGTEPVFYTKSELLYESVLSMYYATEDSFTVSQSNFLMYSIII
jgi:hypothetical protein